MIYKFLLIQQTWEAVYKNKLLRGMQPPVSNDDGSKPTSESNQLMCWSDSQTLDGSSPCWHSAGDGITPHRNEVPQSPLKYCKADGLTMYGEGHNDEEEMLSHQSSRQGSCSSSPAIEKTLYIDSVHMLETSNSRSSSSDIKELMSYTEKDSELLVGNERFHKSRFLLDGLGESNQVKCFKERDPLLPKIFDTSESNPLSCSKGSILGVSMDNGESLRHHYGLVQEAKSLECSKVLINRSFGIDWPQPLDEDQGNSYDISLQSALPPPLPKSPSESWLCRTLPSVSSMNPSSRSYLGVQFGSKKQLLKEPLIDSKWETIVKTSNAQLRFSEVISPLALGY